MEDFCCPKKKDNGQTHPGKLTAGNKNGELEDDFPLQLGGLLGSMLVSRGVFHVIHASKLPTVGFDLLTPYISSTWTNVLERTPPTVQPKPYEVTIGRTGWKIPWDQPVFVLPTN